MEEINRTEMAFTSIYCNESGMQPPRVIIIIRPFAQTASSVHGLQERQ
jgi:hypothetical protein